MFYQNDVFIGVDVSSGQLPYTVAVLNVNGNLLALEKCSLEGAVKYTGGYRSVIVAVNSPRYLPGGKMADGSFRDNLIPPPAPDRFTDHRVAEYLMRVRKVRFSPTPLLADRTPTWINNGFRLYRLLEQTLSPLEDGRSIIEINSQACFQTFLGRMPFHKTSIEGRIQRQLILIDRGVKVHDPMAYYEEVTRHRILQGILPDAMLYLPRQLDAVAAALLASLSYQDPAATVRIGDDSDGWIILPAK